MFGAAMIEIMDSFGRFRRVANLALIKELKPLGIGHKQAKMLRYLAKNPEGSHADLARHTITDPAATGRIVDILVKRGLVIQKAHRTDRRAWVLFLSPKGRVLAKKIEIAYRKTAATLMAPLTVRERVALLGIFNKLTAALSSKGNLL